MSLLDAALRYGVDGIAVFPCLEGAKEPACPNGFKDATTDPARIRELWSNPDFNIGTCPETWGAAVIDLDTKKADGPGAWTKIAAEHGYTLDTFTTETPSGGRHIFYSGSLPTSASKLAPGVDTRGRGGYVLLPPSVVAGKPYRVVKHHDLAELPGGIEAALATSAVAVRAATGEIDSRGNVDRARSLLADYVRRGDVAVEFRGGNNRTYQLTCELLNLGISPEKCGELLEEIWNPACKPPWSSEELGAIIEHAASYAQNEPGAWSVTTAAEAFPDAAKFAAPAEQRKNRFLTVAQMAALPDPVWLVKDVLMEQSTCLLVGAWRSYKSFLALDLALSIAAGLPTAFAASSQAAAPVVYACLEGMAGIAKARRRAWCIGHGLEPDAELPFYLGPAPLINDNADCQAFIEDIRAICGEQPPALVVLDTTSQMMAGLDETRDASLFIRYANELARALPTCVLALHHFGHDKGKGARGGTVYPAGFDTYLEGEAKGERRVEVWVRKQKDAEERSTPFTMQGRKVGPALVFYPVDPKEHNDAISQRDPFSWQSIGAALHALNAHGRDQGVSGLVLAQQIFPKGESEGTGAYSARVAKQARALSALARNRLRAYVEEGEHGKLWFLPSANA